MNSHDPQIKDDADQSDPSNAKMDLGASTSMNANDGVPETQDPDLGRVNQSDSSFRFDSYSKQIQQKNRDSGVESMPSSSPSYIETTSRTKQKIKKSPLHFQQYLEM